MLREVFLLRHAQTVVYLSILYAFGNIVLSISSVPTFNIPKAEVAFLGLVLIALGTGGIKPCVSSFGGDQFVLPQQERQLASFFSLFYFGINIGSLVSTFLTPELSSIPCLGSTTCYPLAFGVPAILMLVSMVLFIAGKPLYTIKEPEGNVMVLVTKCMWSAATNKLCGGQCKNQQQENQLQEKNLQLEELQQQQQRKQQQEEKLGVQQEEKQQLHWLDYADARFTPELRDDIRCTLGVILLFVPLPVFWALYDQQSSRWTFQANNMNGRLGSFIVKPDQMQVLSSVLIVVLLPLMEGVVYPALARCRLLHRPLQKMAVGGLLAAVAFVISGVLELQLEAQPGFIVEPSAGLAQVHLLSGLPCDVTLSRQDAAVTLRSLSSWDDLYVKASGRTTLSFRVHGDCAEGDVQFDVYEKQSNSLHLYEENMVPKLLGPYQDVLTKNVNPSIRIMHRFDNPADHRVSFTSKEQTITVTIRGKNAMDLDSGSYLVEPGRYNVSLDGADFADADLDIGGLYTVLLDDTRGFVKTLVEPNTVGLLWLVPQYVVMGFAEVLLSVTGLEFSFTQAPLSMKSFVSSIYQLTDAFGNLIIILIAEAKILPTQSDEFFLFAGIMTAAMLVFIWLAARYKYRDVSKYGG